jgi:transcriptional regulator with XRE-family HTH domain
MRTQIARERFGERVASLRESRGLTQRELTEKMRHHGMEWAQSTVAKTEKGTRPVPVEEVQLLAEVFGVEPALLLDTEVSERLVLRRMIAEQRAELRRLRQQEVELEAARHANRLLSEEAEARLAELEQAQAETGGASSDLDSQA